MSKEACFHIVGAGLSGLAAALYLARRERKVVLYEAAGQAGGRCRSYSDTKLGETIDNGNHLIFGANAHALEYIDWIGSKHRFIVSSTPALPFVDIREGTRWLMRPFADIPGVSPAAWLLSLPLLWAGRHTTVARALERSGKLYARLWKPLCISILNTPPETASASMLRSVLRQIAPLSRSRRRTASLPWIPRTTLSEALVDPALQAFKALGGKIYYHHTLRDIDFSDKRATALHFGDGAVKLGSHDRVISALPPYVIQGALPHLTFPDTFHSILNVHFHFPRRHIPHPPGEHSVLGITGGMAEWVFLRPKTLSATVSAADTHPRLSEEEAAAAVWSDIRIALGMPADIPMPAYRVIREKRATFACTPANLARRPGWRTPYTNFFLAGDYTDTGLPATIEGAIQSGMTAAKEALQRS